MSHYQSEEFRKNMILFTMWQKKHIKIMQSCDLVIMTQNGNIPYYQANMEELNNTIKELNHLFQLSH